MQRSTLAFLTKDMSGAIHQTVLSITWQTFFSLLETCIALNGYTTHFAGADSADLSRSESRKRQGLDFFSTSSVSRRTPSARRAVAGLLSLATTVFPRLRAMRQQRKAWIRCWMARTTRSEGPGRHVVGRTDRPGFPGLTGGANSVLHVIGFRTSVRPRRCAIRLRLNPVARHCQRTETGGARLPATEITSRMIDGATFPQLPACHISSMSARGEIFRVEKISIAACNSSGWPLLPRRVRLEPLSAISPTAPVHAPTSSSPVRTRAQPLDSALHKKPTLASANGFLDNLELLAQRRAADQRLYTRYQMPRSIP